MRTVEDRPNIVLINCDDLGWGDLGCYGHTLHQTPHLDRMCAEGTRFTAFYQGSPLCSPSRGAMLTGCYPRRIGFDQFDGQLVLFPGQRVGLNPSERTFASVLRERGYATMLVGKWHCGDQPAFLPTRHGFDRYFGLPYSNDMGRQPGRDKSPPLPLMRDAEVVEAQPDQTQLTARYTDECLKFIRESHDRPFLLYLAHMHVHLPLYVDPELVATSRNGRYGAAVAAIDRSTGAILDELRRLGIEHNTLVLFTSDNGSRCDYGASNGPLRGKKGTVNEGGLRVPLLAWWPGKVPERRVSDELVTGIDLLPTFAALAGAPAVQDRVIDGFDLSALLLGKGTDSRRESFFYYVGSHLDAVRDRRWKLVVGRHGWSGGDAGLCELYDLQNDIGETTNVAEQHPQIVRELSTRLDRCRDDLGDATTGAAGSNCRPVGVVENPKPLTEFDPSNQYFQAMYDLKEAG